MSTLMQASRQWASRPDDERFTSLLALHAHTTEQRQQSAGKVVSTRALEVRPAANDVNEGLEVCGPNGHAYTPTNFSFGQLATLAQAPAGYLRSLPAPIAADAMNYGLQFGREAEEVGVLLRRNGASVLAAATGPRYGRIWNADVTGQLVNRFGDGVNGDWRVPGEFGQQVKVTKANTTLYASDRDMFVFLADETNRIVMPDRRGGKSGSLARGFFVWNSEVGATTLGIAMFLFDYVCCNRIVWGAEGYKEIKLRHTVTAPDRFAEEVAPIIADYSSSSPKPIEQVLLAAQAHKLDNVADFLANRRFTKPTVRKIAAAFEGDEGRPMETLWDVTTGITAYARSIPYQDERIALERAGGALLELVET